MWGGGGEGCDALVCTCKQHQLEAGEEEGGGSFAYPLVVCDLQVHVVQQDGAEVLVLVGLEALNLRRAGIATTQQE